MVAVSSLLIVAQVVLAYNPKGYQPTKVICPQGATNVRPASDISKEEREWVGKRHELTDKALRSFLNRAELDFDAEEFLDSLDRSINIGLTFSGGGFRAMLNGAGQIAALDDRVPGALEHGLGGLLQSCTYLVGLSGGNWLTGSLALNNWTSVPELIDQGKWDLTHDFISPEGFNLGGSLERCEEILIDVSKKVFAGYNISITDLWGRALAYQFFGEAEHGGLPLTYSGIREFESFKNAELPLPISLTVGRTPDTKIIDYDQSFFEFTPFEFGSWDPNVYAFTDLKYIGSEVSNGIPNTDVCITGFDNAGFVLGASSSLFNMFLVNFDKFFGKLEGIPRDVVHKAFEVLDKFSADISLFSPNPFYKSQYGNNKAVLNDNTLYLADGGSGWENIPFAPLIQPERDVDIIFAFDESSNTEDKFPSTNSLNKTFERQFGSQGNGTAFPYIPTEQTYIKNKLYEKPLFLGCNSSDLTDLATVPPLVVYIPHQSFSAWSNTSTFQLAYSTKQRDAIIKNAFEATTRFNLTIDPYWPKCVSCAIVRREQERNDISQTPLCQSCFQEYCWNGEQYEGPAVPLRTSNWTSSSL